MAQSIEITKKPFCRGDDGHKVISVRMRDETVARLNRLATETNRSRNELINLLLESALDNVSIKGEAGE